MRILFVCLGNICRSPTAEGVLREIAAREYPHLELEIDSAGTAGFHSGDPPDRRTIAAARRRGYDLSRLRARRTQPEDFLRFDYVLAMDRANLAELESCRPANATARLALFMSFAADQENAEVPDPYYGGTEEFERVIGLCEAAARGLLTHLSRSTAAK